MKMIGKNQDVEKNGHICRKEKNVLFDWQNRQSSITTFSWWIKDESKFCRKNANAQLYSFRKTKLENFWSQVMEAGKINFPNCTKPPKSQNEKKVEAVKTTLVSFTIKDIDCVFSFILVKLDTFLTFVLTFSTFDILLIWHYLDPEKLFHWVSIQSVLSNRPTIHFLSWIGGTEGNGQF